MTTTPPQPSHRIRTPPTPLHGPAYDTYEPYSPRRSKRSTAQSNPYSSLNAERSPPSRNFLHSSATTPPPSTAANGKRARFARAPTHLSSPPSSPASPIIKRQHATPRARGTTTSHAHKAARTSTSSESDVLSSPPQPNSKSRTHLVPPTAMLPTPSKTPSKKRPAQSQTLGAARVLTFQPNDPNDVMPSPRKLKTHHRPNAGMTGFELDDSDDVGAARNGVRGGRSGAKAGKGGRSEGIEIYTDANARVPVWDESEENPFIVGNKDRGADAARERPRPQRRNRKTREEVEREEAMSEAVGRGEGVVYVFRGKKLFRRFDDDAAAQNGDVASQDDISTTPTQRLLRHQAGPAAQRPLTRSAIKPRLLFPPAAQQHREQGLDDVDEEAATDIEMAEPVHGNEEVEVEEQQSLTPPQSEAKKGRARGKGRRGADADVDLSSPRMELTPGTGDGNQEEEDAAGILSTDAPTSPASTRAPANKLAAKVGFESWQRTKGGVRSTTSGTATTGRKRAGEGGEEGASGGGKRARGAAGLIGTLG